MTTPSDKSSMMFASLVAMFNTQAMMAMGKIPNPMSGTIERHLPGAQMMIDMLEMVEERTRGNLSSDEQRFLAGTLSDLRLNYVYEVNNEAGTGPASDAAPEAGDGGEIGNGAVPADDAGIPDSGPESSVSDNHIPDNVA